MVLSMNFFYFFSRSAGDGPDIYKGKICSLKARVRQSVTAVLFTLHTYVQLCKDLPNILINVYVLSYYFEYQNFQQ